MRKTVAAIVCAWLAFPLLTHAQGGATKAPAELAKIRESYRAAVNKKDAKGVAMLYAEDGMEMPPNEPTVKGRAAIEAFNKKLFTEFTPTLTITSWDVQAAGDLATDVGAYTQTLTPAAGGAPIKDSGKYVVVLKRTSGQWTVAYAIYNSDLPPPAPPMKK